MLTTATTAARPTTTWWRRPAVRWLLTFAAFPLGSVAARAIAGPVDSTMSAVVGGFVNGAVIGAAQGWALRPVIDAWRRWALATAVGLMIGLGVAATAVDFGSSMSELAVQGAICGLAVGAAQAVVLVRHLGRLALAWPFVLAALWALGWTITTAVGVEVDDHFTSFGSSGAVTVTALTLVLPVLVARRGAR
jgi:hypothetical protein